MIHKILFTAAFFAFMMLPLQAKEKLMILSWGDVIWKHRGEGTAQLDTPEKVREAARIWKARGVTKVLFRVDDFRIILFHEIKVASNNPYIQEWAKVSKKAWDDGLLKVAVEAIHREGMKVDMWVTIFDEGCPPMSFIQTPTFSPGNPISRRKTLNTLPAIGLSPRINASTTGANWSGPIPRRGAIC